MRVGMVVYSDKFYIYLKRDRGDDEWYINVRNDYENKSIEEIFGMEKEEFEKRYKYITIDRKSPRFNVANLMYYQEIAHKNRNYTINNLVEMYKEVIDVVEMLKRRYQ